MAIELGFAFAVGVSCLVFSVNLVRKLREEDAEGSGEGTRGAASSRGRTGGYPYRTNFVRGSARNLGLGVRGIGDSVTEGSVGLDGGYVRIGGGGDAGTPGIRRGIGSLLTRSVSPALEMYDSEEEYEEAVAPQGVGQRLGGGELGLEDAIAGLFVDSVFSLLVQQWFDIFHVRAASHSPLGRPLVLGFDRPRPHSKPLIFG